MAANRPGGCLYHLAFFVLLGKLDHQRLRKQTFPAMARRSVPAGDWSSSVLAERVAASGDQNALLSLQNKVKSNLVSIHTPGNLATIKRISVYDYYINLIGIHTSFCNQFAKKSALFVIFT